MPKYDAVVIGAGNGGLAAACRMAKGGKKTLLIERHNMPGGCASSFRRGRFEFETALHEICEWGTKENPGGCRRICDEFGLDIPWHMVRITSALSPPPPTAGRISTRPSHAR